eukprot:3895620-Amphidinium_carterae.1
MLSGRRFSIPEEEWGLAWLSEVEDLEWDCIERPLDAKDVSSMPPLGGDNAVARTLWPQWLY